MLIYMLPLLMLPQPYVAGAKATAGGVPLIYLIDLCVLYAFHIYPLFCLFT
ncbi:hypothetical protein E1A91_A12G127400v1 [Gossypium mustelinum]|uniref:Uncharacterized protein n=1 Tax=Gossypium mustelinum TaxID=34275 RepID=A0A5D2WTP3_GOSMU|nr:hypothetical protein E1A91_A12G127400v1 [Gossypium mustelinum]